MNEAKAFRAPEFLKELRRLRLEPGDTLVARCREWLTPEIEARFKRSLEAFFPDNQVLVLDGGIALGAISEAGPRPLSEVQQQMLSDLTGDLAQTMAAGDVTPFEAAEVLRRLVHWLEGLDGPPIAVD